MGHTTLSIPHRVRSNVLSRASDDAVPAKVFLAPMSVVPGAAHTQRRHTTLSILPPATVRFPHWDGSPRCKHRGVVCKAIRAYSPMSLGPDVCCTGPLTRKDVSTTEISSGKTSLFAYPAAGKAPFLPRCSHQRGVSVSTHRAKSNASKSPANSRRRRPLKASQGRPKCHSLRIR